jgi:lipopolysaccharide export LptBFGC system permease protein LptF
MDQLFDLTDLLLNKKAGIFNIAKLFAYVLPSLFMFTVPISVLAATVLLFMRLNDDNEMTAMRTSGLSPASTIRPVLIAAGVLSAVMMYFNSTVTPGFNSKFKLLYYRLLYTNPVMQFSEKNFIEFPNYNIYVNKIKHNNTLKGVLIYKWQDKQPTITTAETAEMFLIEEKGLLFRLNRGQIFYANPENAGELDTIKFAENEAIINLSAKPDFLLNRESTARELKSAELLKKAKAADPHARDLYLLEYHLRFAVACAGFLFVFIAAPLAIFQKKRSKGYGITATVAVIFVYYMLQIAGTTLCEKGILWPAAAAWLPNILIGGVGIAMMLKVAK